MMLALMNWFITSVVLPHPTNRPLIPSPVTTSSSPDFKEPLEEKYAYAATSASSSGTN
jgi:hypothetical protein